MIRLNDYLYSGDTVLKILKKYSDDLGRYAAENSSVIDMEHSRFLAGILYQLEHNDYLTYQSNRIKEFYKYMAERYPFLAFTLRGRIKSVIRSEEKFNGYIVEYIYKYYVKNHACPPNEELLKQLMHFRDFIAYRIVVSLPRCHVSPGQDREEQEIRYLYEIANALPGFLERREFTPEPANVDGSAVFSGEETDHAGEAGAAGSGQAAGLEGRKAETGKCGQTAGLAPSVRRYYRDYVATPKESGYRSLHIGFYDNASSSFIEVQLRTHEMDDFAEIGTANHGEYEKQQNISRRRRDAVPRGESRLFDEAYERGIDLQNLDLSKVDVNMFTAYSNELMNDGCGLYHGRLILPFEHLSRFQNDLIG